MARSKRVQRDRHVTAFGPQGGHGLNDNSDDKDTSAYRIRNDSTVDDIAAADVLTEIAAGSIHPSIETSGFSPAVPPSRRSSRLRTGLAAPTAQEDEETSNKLFVRGLDPGLTNNEGEGKL